MAGNKLGGKLAAQTNKKRHGKNFYAVIGAKGGKVSSKGGFASNKVGEDGLTGKERAKLVGARGGAVSRRGKAKPKKSDVTLAA